MCKKLFCAAAFALAAFALPADDFDLTLPDDVSNLADELVSLIVESVPHSARNPVLVAIRSVGFEGTIPPFGELLAMTVSTRVAMSGEAGLRVRAQYPVDSYLMDFSSAGGELSSEGDFATRPDFVLVGEAFEADGTLHVLFQLIEVADETIVGGTEDALPLESWLADLLRVTGGGDESGGFVEADRFEPDSADDPLIVGTEESVEGRTIAPAGDEDWYVITADGIEGKALLTVSTSGETDTYIEVYGPDEPSAFLAENDDGDDANAEVSVLLQNGQTVWVLVRGYDESVEGMYDFHSNIKSFEGDPNEPDNSIEEANQLMVGQEAVESYIMPGTDEDWYYVDIVEVPGDNTILSFETHGDLDTVLDLYDADGIEMLSNDDGGEGENARVDFFIDRPGKYYVKVRHYDASDQGPYSISADFVQARPDQFEPDDSRTEARQIRPDGTSQTKNFTPADDVDWVTFTLSETSNVVIRTTGDVDTYLKLYDRMGSMIAEDDDSGGDYNALIERLLQRGQYFVRIHQVEGDAVFGAEYAVLISTD